VEIEERRDGHPALPLGRLITLQVRFAHPLSWFGPIWAALCGALASGEMALDVAHLLLLVTVLFLIDLALGTVWELALNTDWSSLSSGRDSEQALSPQTVLMLPYAAQNSPNQRISSWLGRVMTWGRTVLWPGAGTAILGLIVSALMAIVMAAFLGRSLVLLTLAALATATLALLLTYRREGEPLWLRAFFEVGLTWLIGHAAFGPFTWSSLLAGWLYTGLYQACLALSRNQNKRAIVRLNVFQLAIVALLVVIKQPLSAGFAGLLMLPPLSLQPFLGPGETGPWYLRRSQPFLMLNMLVTALAIG
jgi:hypothetical protein